MVLNPNKFNASFPKHESVTLYGLNNYAKQVLEKSVSMNNECMIFEKLGWIFHVAHKTCMIK